MSGSCLRALRAISLLLPLTLLGSISLFAEPRPAPTKAPALVADYTRALAAADRFLQAWQAGDIETGTVMLTGHAKDKTTQDKLDRMFSSSAPAAYEIQRGKFLRHGRCNFPVVLLGPPSDRRPWRRLSSIVVLNAGNSDWEVDKVP